MKKLFVSMLFSLVCFVTTGQEFSKLWEANTLEAPESVILNSETNEFYVSNVSGQPAEKNEMGFISVLDSQGGIKNKKWITGLNAPKGMAIYQNQLFIADIDRVVVVDIKTGQIIRIYDAEGATFLNDVETDLNGNVYITDTFGGNAIYQIKDGTIDLWLKDDRLNYPNGLSIRDDKLFVSTWGVVTNPETFETEVPGMLLAVDLEEKSISMVTSPFGNLDGLQELDGTFLVSDWIAGRILSVDSNGSTKELIDLNAGSADILYLQEQEILLVPQMLDGSLTAYSLER